MLSMPVFALAEAAVPQMTTVLVLGLGIVFIGLALIICLIWVMSTIVKAFTKKKADKPAEIPAEVPATKDEPITDRQQIVAAVSAVIAQVMGKDVKGVRIVSFKRVD
mgnify:CR=1 FL=1